MPINAAVSEKAVKMCAFALKSVYKLLNWETKLKRDKQAHSIKNELTKLKDEMCESSVSKTHIFMYMFILPRRYTNTNR